MAAACVALGACASPPTAIDTPPPGDLQLVEARADPDGHAGTPVRWGGTIMSLEVSESDSWVEVLERKLDAYGEPLPDSPTDGRFLVRLPGPADGAVFTAGREITVAGVLEGSVAGAVGKRPYRFPVVGAREYRLWSPYARYGPYPLHPWYGPYDPFYHHRPYRYW